MNKLKELSTLETRAFESSYGEIIKKVYLKNLLPVPSVSNKEDKK